MKKRTTKQVEDDIKHGSKVCGICGKRKPLKEYPISKARKDGRLQKCKLCHSEYSKKWKQSNREAYLLTQRRCRLKKAYNITLEEYDSLLKEQGKVCAICKSPINKGGADKAMPVNHCHKTGEVRGILCTFCNRALGYLEDDTRLLKEAIKYLEK